MFVSPKYIDKNILISTSINISDNEHADKELFFNSIGVNTDNLIYMNQTHSNNVVVIDKNNKSLYPYKNEKAVMNTDAIITSEVNTPLLVRTADCLPLVVYAKDKKAIAVIHAGWRGIVSKIIPKTIELMKDRYSICLTNTYIYLGPRICLDNYQVGLEVAELFSKKIFKNNSWYVDIGAEAREQLLSIGIVKENIEDSKLETFNDKKFYSYRRDKNKSGRIFTVAMIRG